MGQPVRTDAIADLPSGRAVTEPRDAPDRLMAQDDRKSTGDELTGGDLKVGATHRAGADADQQLAGTGDRHRDLFCAQWARRQGSGTVQSHGTHNYTLA